MRVQATVVLSTFFLTLAACGGGGGGGSVGGGNPPPPPPPPPPATYTVGGTVSGLNGTLVLQNNAGNDLNVAANGAFAFSTAAVTGTAYAVTVLTQPAGQTCTPSSATGSIAAVNVTTVTLTCVNDPLAFLTSDPQNGSSNAARTVSPTLTFDRPLDAGTVAGAVSFSSDEGDEPMTAAAAGAVITITPSKRLLPVSYYTAGISTGVRGSNGELLASATEVLFQTGDGTWQPSAPLRAAPLPAGNQDGIVSMVSDANGNAMAVWPNFNGLRRNLVASRYVPATGWSEPELIELQNLGDASAPQLTVDAAGNVTAVWLQSDGTRNNAWSNRFTVNGAAGSWGAPTLIESDDGTAVEVEVAANAGGAVTALIVQSDGARLSLYATRHSGGAWSTPALIETNNSENVVDIDVAADAQNNAVAVWRISDGARYNVWSNRSVSGNWGTAELIETNDVVSVFAPKVAMNPTGTIVAVWVQLNDETREVVANRYLPGSGWSGSRVLDTTGVWLDSTVGFDKSGRAFVSWFCDHGGLRVCLSTFGMGGIAWSLPDASAVVTGTASGKTGLRLTIDSSGHAMATWMTQVGFLNGGNASHTARVTAMRYLLGWGGWGAPQYLDALETYNSPLSSDSRLQSVMETNGSVLAVWLNQARNLITRRFE